MHLHLYNVFHLQQNVTQIKNSRENCETFNFNFYKKITTQIFFFKSLIFVCTHLFAAVQS